MSIKIITGDCRDVLRTLPPESVHCVVTSPPYWGLRDYGTAQWEGGDPACEHLGKMHSTQAGFNARYFGKSFDNDKQGELREPFGQVCGLCGARRIDSQIGLESSLGEYIATMVEVFREVRRVLRKDGTLWLNMGDSYASSVNGRPAADIVNDDRTFRDKPFSTIGPISRVGASGNRGNVGGDHGFRIRAGNPNPDGGVLNQASNRAGLTGFDAGYLKPKDMCGIPWRLAFALQADGWWLRQDIIWSKPNPMPESVTDRCTKAHEYLFLLTKAERYYYDAEAIAEPNAEPKSSGGWQSLARKGLAGWQAGYQTKKGDPDRADNGFPKAEYGNGRNRRSVWEIATAPFNGSHLLADYVGADGIPYKRSEDCPIHGRNDYRETLQTVSGDGPSNLQSLRNPGSDSRHALELGAEPGAIPSMSSCTNGEETSPAHDLQSIAESKKLGPSPTLPVDGLATGGEFLSHSDDTPASPNSLDRETDLPRPGNSEPAMPHNSESRKTDLAPETSSACNASVQTGLSTGDKSGLFALFDSADRKPASNIEQDDLASRPLPQKTSHTARKSSASKNNRCTCERMSIDHFATFPPALIEPCIKAGTSERGCCAKCGKPWVRKTEKTFVFDQTYRSEESAKRIGKMAAENHRAGFPRGTVSHETLNWSPSCACNAEVVPCTVLDPFGGAGTTGLVADRLGRNAILIELNPAYAAMAERRLRDDAGMFAQIQSGTPEPVQPAQETWSDMWARPFDYSKLDEAAE